MHLVITMIMSDSFSQCQNYNCYLLFYLGFLDVGITIVISCYPMFFSMSRLLLLFLVFLDVMKDYYCYLLFFSMSGLLLLTLVFLDVRITIVISCFSRCQDYYCYLLYQNISPMGELMGVRFVRGIAPREEVG